MLTHNTWVHLNKDPFLNMMKVEASPPHMVMAFSLEQLTYAKSPGALIQNVVDTMAKHFASAFEQQLLKALGLSHPELLSKPELLDPAPLSGGMDAIQKWGMFWSHIPTEDLLADEPVPEKMKELISEVFEGAWMPVPETVGEAVTHALFDAIPGFAQMKQMCPECTAYGTDGSLRSTIIHLNDHHKWTRERIADWLETLDHDLTFKMPEEVNEDAGHTDT